MQRNPKLKNCAEHRYSTIYQDDHNFVNEKDLTNHYVHNGPRMLPILNTGNTVSAFLWVSLIPLRLLGVREALVSVTRNWSTYYSSAAFLFSFAKAYRQKRDVRSKLLYVW